MPLGPVFRHEMLAAGRKRRYVLLRVVLGALLLAMLGIAHESTRQMSTVAETLTGEATDPRLSIAATSQLAASFYGAFAWFTLFGVLGATPAIAAGAIATERERRTIEYLFATDLSNAEIVVDKLAARLLVVVAIVASALPLLAIFRLMGGVPADLVLLHFGQLVTATAMIAAISIAVSTWSERARDAVPRAYSVVFLTMIAPVALAGFNSEVTVFAPSLVDWFTRPLEITLKSINPIWTLGDKGGVGGGVLGVDLDTPAMLVSMAAQLAVAAGCLALCVVAVRRVHLASSGRVDKPSRRRAARRRPPPSDTSPVLWKERYASTQLKRGGRSQSIVIGFVVAAMVASSLYSLWDSYVGLGRDAWQTYFQYAAVMVGFLGPIVALLAGCRAAGSITYEKERDTWLSLLTTPLRGGEIVRAKLLGNAMVFRWGVLGVVALPALGMAVRPAAWPAVLAVAVVGVVTVFATSAIGLWLSLQFRSSVKAIGLTIAVLVGLGGAYLPFMMTFLMIAGVDGDEAMIFFAPCVPFLFVAPIILVFEHTVNEPFLPTYILGVGGYAVLGILAAYSSTHRFDEFCERGDGHWRPPEPAAEAGAA